jgi:hypothetical protein
VGLRDRLVVSDAPVAGVKFQGPIEALQDDISGLSQHRSQDAKHLVQRREG